MKKVIPNITVLDSTDLLLIKRAQKVDSQIKTLNIDLVELKEYIKDTYASDINHSIKLIDKSKNKLVSLIYSSGNNSFNKEKFEALHPEIDLNDFYTKGKPFIKVEF